MSFFYKPNESGKGVAKNGPEKKAFFKFFELFGRKFWKLIVLNLIYVAFCIPIITFGPATAALTHMMRKFILEEPVFIFSDFLDAFKKNFKSSIFIGIVDIIVAAGFVSNIFLINQDAAMKESDMYIVIFVASIILGVLFIIMNFYLYLQMVTLELPFSSIIKNSFLFIFLGVFRNIVSLAFCVGFGAAFVLLFPISLIAIPFIPFSQLAFLITFNSYPAIQKYVIIPYYEKTGEKNPEIKNYISEEQEEKSLFTDLGGQEQEIKAMPKAKGKVIK